ncbi:hypothetical protein K501DRAFT_228811 [Backusella circina FSU 941]|nr:hypothetical protein K501DRAFT_228811 [Backusella circina FSU 941]
MGGIVIEYSALIKKKKNKKTFITVSCLNCEMSPVYSIKEQDDDTKSDGRVIIHENALCGIEFEAIKNAEEYSNTFNIKVVPTTSTTDIPQAIPEELHSTQQQLKTVLDQSIEKLTLESKVRIEKYKKEEERKLQDFITQAKLENSYLLTRLIDIHDEVEQEEQEDKGHHVRFNNKVENDNDVKMSRKIGFALDEHQIKGLENKILTQRRLGDGEEVDDEQEEEEEDMFNLDEEFSEDDDKENRTESPESSHDVLGTSWVRKKRNTDKYMTEDFDISKFKNTALKQEQTEEDVYLSKYATSVPISIHYPQLNEEDEEDEEQEESNKKSKKDLLTSSFANYDFSYSDRMLSEQFPQRRRKSLVSNSLIRPQLDTLVGKSLDTRGIMQKKQNKREKDEENFGPMLPPHLWTAMAAKEEEEEGNQSP